MTTELERLRSESDIRDLLHRFAMAIDDRDWTAFHECLCDEVSVQLDSSIGGSDPTPQDAREWVANARSFFDPLDATHHQLTVYRVELRGDEASVLTYFRAGHYKKHLAGGATFDQVGRYEHQCIRADGQWRIAKWVQKIAYSEGNAALLAKGGDAAH